MKKYLRLYTIVLSMILYLLTVKAIRPYVYDSQNHFSIFKFLLGVLPNFLGSIMVFWLYRTINSSVKTAIVFSLLTPVFMELERYYVGYIPFDIYDILASIFGVFIAYVLDRNYFNENFRIKLV